MDFSTHRLTTLLLLLLATGEISQSRYCDLIMREFLLPTVALGNAQSSQLTVDSHDITVLLNSNETFLVFAK